MLEKTSRSVWLKKSKEEMRWRSEQEPGNTGPEVTVKGLGSFEEKGSGGKLSPAALPTAGETSGAGLLQSPLGKMTVGETMVAEVHSHKWLDSRHILKGRIDRLADGLNGGCKKREESKLVFGLSNWMNSGAIACLLKATLGGGTGSRSSSATPRNIRIKLFTLNFLQKGGINLSSYQQWLSMPISQYGCQQGKKC